MAFSTEDRKEWLLDSLVHETLEEPVFVPVTVESDSITFEFPTEQGEWNKLQLI